MQGDARLGVQVFFDAIQALGFLQKKPARLGIAQETLQVRHLFQGEGLLCDVQGVLGQQDLV